LSSSLHNAPSSDRQWLYWQVLHEVLVLDLDTAKWDKLVELRLALGEQAVVPAIESLRSKNSLSEKFEGLVKQWDTHNVFGGPTLVSDIRRFLTAEVSASAEPEPVQAKPSPPDETPADAPPKLDAQEPKKEEAPAEATEDTPAEKAKKEKARDEEVLVEPAQRRGSLSTAKEITYDFDSKVGWFSLWLVSLWESLLKLCTGKSLRQGRFARVPRSLQSHCDTSNCP
jgi:outer membrane biosynthesis protein TonB